MTALELALCFVSGIELLVISGLCFFLAGHDHVEGRLARLAEENESLRRENDRLLNEYADLLDKYEGRRTTRTSSYSTHWN